ATPVFTVDDANRVPVANILEVLAVNLDSDAALEIVARGNTAVILDGAYPFTSPEALDTGIATDLTPAFLNDDAFLDLAGSQGGGMVAIYNDGTGAFGPPFAIAGPGAFNVIASATAGDVDGNGLDDVIVFQNSSQFYLFYNQ